MKLLKEYGKNKSNLESEALREMLADDIIAIVVEDNVSLESVYTSGNMNEEDKEYITMVDQEDDGEI